MNIWNAEGLIPPIDDSDPTSPHRSPYRVSLTQFVQIFAISLDRCAILAGYLSHRAELHRLGLVEGFQWVNGSFSENIELIERRPPGDVDVVTYAAISNEFLDSLEPEDQRLLTDHDWIKETFKVDFYAQSLTDDPEFLVEISAYWYSIWSHRRSKQWKGFLTIDLDPANDMDALQALDARREELEHEQE